MMHLFFLPLIIYLNLLFFRGATARFKVPRRENVSEKEKRLLYEEFKSHMYSNFLNGKDPDFDYR